MNRFLYTAIIASFSFPGFSELNYQRKDLGSEYYCDYIGNSFDADVAFDKETRLVKHVQNQLEALYVDSDGFCFTNAYKVERFISCCVYNSEGDMIEVMDDFYRQGRDGGYAVTADTDYVYCGFVIAGKKDRRKENDNNLPRQPQKGTYWYGIRRYHRSTGNVAGFPEGYGVNEGMLVVYTDIKKQSEHISGLAVCEGELFVSDPNSNSVKVYNTSRLTQKPVREFVLKKGTPGALAIDSEKALWVVEKTAPAVLRYHRSGKHAGSHDVELPEGTLPGGIAVDMSGNKDRLLVCDQGKDLNIKIFTNLGKNETRAPDFGIAGGIYSGVPGKIKDRKFHIPKGIGADGAGNIYVAQIQPGRNGAMLESYDPKGQLRWRRMALPFTGAACIDPDDETVIYTPEEIFSYDYKSKPGKGWTYNGMTVAKGDSGRDGNVRVLYISGRKLLFNISNSGFQMNVFRFIEDSMCIENVYSFDDAKGFDICSDGTVWIARSENDIQKMIFNGFDKNEKPSWSIADTIPVPASFIKVHRIMYDEENDAMYLVGYTKDLPYRKAASGTKIWKKAGKWIAKYENWSKGNRNPSWEIESPWDDHADREQCQSTAIAGDYLFAVIGSKGKDFKSNKNPYDQPIIFIFDKKDGKLVGTMQPDENVGSHAMVDISHSLNAYKQNNGDYLILCEDCAFTRVLIYRWKPTR